jgi:hypothetical protein
MTLLMYRVAVFARLSVKLLVTNTVVTVSQSLRYVLFIAVPILAFSGVGVLHIVALRALNDYHLLGDGPPRVIWGEVLTALALTVVLGTVALAFSPGGWPLIGDAFGGTLWYSLLGYLVASLAAVSLPLLYYPLDWVDVRVPELRPGEVWVINLVVLALFALVGTTMLFSRVQRLAMPLLIGLSVAFLSVASVLGVDPIRAAIWDASRAEAKSEASGTADGARDTDGPVQLEAAPTPTVRRSSPAARTPTATATGRSRAQPTETIEADT